MSLSRKTGRVWLKLTSSVREKETDSLCHSMSDIENIFAQGTYKKRTQWLSEVSLVLVLETRLIFFDSSLIYSIPDSYYDR